MKSEQLLSTLLCSHAPRLISLKFLGNRQRIFPIQKREKNPLTLKNRKTRSGQGQMVPREIITQTQEARTLKETENWSWIIFQLINCWNGANSTSGHAFIKLQDWVTLTSYCLSPCLSNQTRKPITQTGSVQQCCPIPQILLKQLQVSHPRFITISAAQRHNSPRYLIPWNAGGKTSLYRPNIPWNCCCSCSLIPPRCSGNAALWQSWGMRNSPRALGFNRMAGCCIVQHISMILTAQKVCGPEGPTKNIKK